MATWIPAVIGAMGYLSQGNAQREASRYNANVMAAQAKASSAEGYQTEAQQRQASREFLGKQSAAVGASGAGYGGSNALVMDQSAVNAELDALNIRYRSDLRGKGLLAQSVNEKRAGNSAADNSYLMAGAQLLRGNSAANYGLSS